MVWEIFFSCQKMFLLILFFSKENKKFSVHLLGRRIREYWQIDERLQVFQWKISIVVCALTENKIKNSK